MTALLILDIILFVVFSINILYLLIFSISSHCKTATIPCAAETHKRIAVLIPAYKEDAVIMECVESCMLQNYPKEEYDIIVISDRMQESTNRALSASPVTLVQVFFENSTKSKALNYAMALLNKKYDLALILDADNTIFPEFLSQLNNVFADPKIHIVQAHRCAKNLNTNLSMLDAISEEINNGIFRLGHANLGLSAALIGSGMCFDYNLFKQTMLSIDAIGGFDRALELTLLYDGYQIHYMAYADVLDEKVQRHRDFTRQRRRWLSAQLHYLGKNIKKFPKALATGKWDYCDKMFQQMSIPRVMLLGFCIIIAAVVTCIEPSASIKWWSLLGLLFIALLLAVPVRLFSKRFLMAVVQLPYFFLLMALNLFRLKGANKKFIHTEHGVK